MSCPFLTKDNCFITALSSPVSMWYLVHVLRGGEKNQNRANISSVREQLESADNVEHYFRGANCYSKGWGLKVKGNN